jgi:hypothetical protein
MSDFECNRMLKYNIIQNICSCINTREDAKTYMKKMGVYDSDINIIAVSKIHGASVSILYFKAKSLNNQQLELVRL